jgi:nitrate/TMAO reductase-like tetraheme cytochrome c subunit
MNKPKIRKVNTAKRKKERKIAEEALKRKTSMFLDIPEECCVCEAAFDKRSKEMAQSWQVVVFEERKKIRLTCPDCWKKVKTTMEEANES